MSQPGDYARGRGPGYTRAVGFGPQGQDPRMRPPATPAQFRQDAPPRDDPRALRPQYVSRPAAQPAFTPGYPQAPRPPRPPRSQYPQSQPAWQQQPYPPQQYSPRPQYAPAARKKRRVFLWVFLAVQALFIILIIVQVASHPAGPTAAQQAAQQCANNGWYPLFKSQADCQVHFGHALNDASDIGKGIGVGLIIVFWIVVDFFLGLGYGIYRLASRR